MDRRICIHYRLAIGMADGRAGRLACVRLGRRGVGWVSGQKSWRAGGVSDGGVDRRAGGQADVWSARREDGQSIRSADCSATI